MMMMKNNRPSASKLGCNDRRERKLKQKSSPRSPLKVKDLNVSSSCSSSSTATTASSISSEDPRNCLRFFLSHHPSSTTTVSKKACNKPKSVVAKTPKSAPNVKNLRGKSSNVNVVMRKCNNLQNPEKPTSKRVHILRKNPPLSSRSDLSDKLSSGSELKLCGNAVNSTPVTKLGSGCFDSSISHDKTFKSGDNDSNCSEYTSPVPPVQVSVSPEIQGGSTSIVPATPTTCYGAGHVLSGVSDKRKCKPRGILTIGNNDLFGSGKAKIFDNGDENVIMTVNNRRASIVRSPTEASVHWLLSPCDEKRSEEGQEDDDGSGLRLDHREHSSRSHSISCLSSPSSSLGFSSEVLNKSNGSITTSDATTTTHSSSKNKSSFVHSDSSSESRGLLGPSLDYLVCSPAPSSPVLMPSYKLDVSPTQVKYQYDHEGDATPYMEDSLGSGNVIRTPQSDSSSLNLDLSRDEISRLWFECELDSEAEVLRRVSLSPECQIPAINSSFEFNPLIKPASSIDFTLFRKAVGSQIPAEVPGSLLHNLPESEVGISWREVLASHIFEMDDLDCCRCFSDEEDDANGSFSCQELGAVDPCKESTSNDDGGSLPAPDDSG